MPTDEFRCVAGHRFHAQRPVTGTTLSSRCPGCRSPARRSFGPPGLVGLHDSRPAVSDIPRRRGIVLDGVTASNNGGAGFRIEGARDVTIRGARTRANAGGGLVADGVHGLDISDSVFE